MTTITMDDDIYSLENLRPAPPKPPKPMVSQSESKKKDSKSKVSTNPDGSSSSSSQSKGAIKVNNNQQQSSSSPLSQSSSVIKSQQSTQGLCLERSFSLQESTPISGLTNCGKPKKSLVTRLQSNPITESENRLATLTERDSFGPRTLLNGSSTVSSSIEMSGLVSATSSSLFHGIILLLIMLTSLAAFVASKLSDPCEDFYLTDNLECSTLTSISFSVINILSCLYSFTIYFLHLIGQCDYITWSARRKVSAEILCTLGMISALTGSIVALFTKTLALKNTVSLVASVFSMVTIFLYFIRSGLLLREIRMLWSKPLPISRQASTVSRKTSTTIKSQDGSTSKQNSIKSQQDGSRKWSISRSSLTRVSVSSAGHQQQSTCDSVKFKPRGPNVANSQPINSIANDTELEDEVFIS